MRLIDADALLRTIIGYPYGYRGMAESDIENQPTVDAVPVIRCKDCLFSTCIEGKHDWWECDFDHRVNHGNGFCNWAERKEE